MKSLIKWLVRRELRKDVRIPRLPVYVAPNPTKPEEPEPEPESEPKQESAPHPADRNWAEFDRPAYLRRERVIDLTHIPAFLMRQAS